MGSFKLGNEGPVRIAGAGPAGLACAIQLASAGIAVQVHEARGAVGGRFHGGHQILPCFGARPRAADLLAMLGIQPHDLEMVPLRSACFQGGRTRRVVATSRQPFALLIRRGPDAGTLDDALLSRARSAGVEVRLGSRLDVAHAHVVATGPAQVDGLALEMVFRTESADRVEVLLDRGLTRDGYAYLFVCAGRGTLGVTTVSAYQRLDDLLHEALTRFARASPLDLRGPRTARAAMSFFIPRSAAAGGRLRVGEAAGFQDFLYGLGIRSALLSGILAARALLVGADYDQLWKSALRRRMRTSLVERYLYEQFSVGGGGMLNAVRHVDLQHALERVQADSPWKRMLLPWVESRWARGDRGCKHDAPAHWCRRPRSEQRRDLSTSTRDGGLVGEGGS